MAVQNLELPIFDILPETVIDYQQLLSMSTQKLTSGPWTTYSMVPCIWSEVKWSEVAQLCPTLCDPMDCSLPGSSVYGIFQATILEWVAISFSRGTSRDWGGGVFSSWASHWGGLSYWGAQTLGGAGFSSCGAQASVPPRHVGSSWMRNRIGIPCIARWILNHRTIREAQ